MNSTTIRARNLAAAVSMALAASGSHAATISVDSADDDPDSTACNLRSALKAVNDGSALGVPNCSAAVSGDPFGTNDTVVLAGLSPITLTQGALTITASSVTIDGSGTIPPGSAPSSASSYQYQVINAAGVSRVLSVANGVKLSANGVMFTGGQTTGNGGGISIGTGATVILNNCSISTNVTTAEGGAIYAAPSSTLKLVDSIVSGNASFAGGAFFANDSTVTVTNTSIAYNEANYGGGVYSLSGALNLEKASIYGNTGRTYSGGVFVTDGALTMASSRVFGNDGGRAGGMFLSGATGTITTSTIDGNTARCGFACGGAILLDKNSMLAVTGSTISGNLAAGLTSFVTGGVNLLRSTATFANSTISGNVAAGRDLASGAFSQEHLGGNTSLTLINTTVSHNTGADVYGTAVGGVLIGTAAFSPPPPGYDTFTAQNTIISGNAPSDREIAFDEFSTSLAVQYSLLGSTQNVSAFDDPANHNIFSDSPELGPLQNNGGPTKTHALLPDSPALSAGSTALAVFSGQPLNFDQRGPGYPRILGGTVDIGAFEHQPEDRLFASGFESDP